MVIDEKESLMIRVIVLSLLIFLIPLLVFSQPTQGDVIINEFVVSPTADQGKEFIELLVVAESLDLRGWTLSDCASRVSGITTQEGTVTLPNRSYLSNVPRGTYLIVELSVPFANSSLLLQDTSLFDSTPKRLILKTKTSGVDTSGTMDLITSTDNIHLFAGSRASGTIIDQVLIGTSTSLITGADWGDNNAGTTADNLRGVSNRSYSFIPENVSLLSSFRANNDTLRWTIQSKSNQQTPGYSNKSVEDKILSGLDTIGILFDHIARIFVDIPDSATNAFIMPENSHLADFDSILQRIHRNESSSAIALANSYNYELYRFRQSEDYVDTLWVLRENFPITRGWGTYIYNPTSRKQYMVQAPHPIWDTDSWKLAIESYQRLNAGWFLMAGTHRYANKYELVNDTIPSDMAHVKQSVFHTAHRTIGAETVLQFHGFSKTGDKTGYPDVVLSNGSTSPNEIIHTLDEQLELQGFTSGVYQSGDPDGVGLLGATHNEQGKWSRPNGKIFIHIESNTPLRTQFNNRILVENALENTFPFPLIDQPLPVSLSAFSFQKKDQQIHIYWRTESELNHVGFNLHRDNIKISGFDTNSELLGVGNSTTSREYDFIDKIEENIHFITYQLQAISLSGHEEWYTISGAIEKITHFRIISNYPNPFNQTTIINYEIKNAGKVKLSVIDILGRVVDELVNEELIEGIYEITFHANKLSSGMYFLQLSDEEKTDYHKIIFEINYF